MLERDWHTVTTADDVTPEILDMAEGIADGWYLDRPIDWEDLFNRLEGSILDNGQSVDLGPEDNSPAMRKIRREILARRRS